MRSLRLSARGVVRRLGPTWRRVVKITPIGLLATTIIADFALIALICLLWRLPQEAKFVIDAETETVTLVVPPGQRPPPWGQLTLSLPSADDPEAGALRGCRAAKLRLKEVFSAPLSLNFVAEGGQMRLTMFSDDPSLGELSCENRKGVTDAPAYAVAAWSADADRPATLRLDGQLTVGAEPTPNSQNLRLLRKGALQVEARSWPFHSGAYSAETALLLGDKVEVSVDHTGSPARAFGVVRLEKEVLHVVAYASGMEAHVQRAGQGESEPLVVAPTFMARMHAQAEWAVLLALGALALHLLASLERLLQARRANAP